MKEMTAERRSDRMEAQSRARGRAAAGGQGTTGGAWARRGRAGRHARRVVAGLLLAAMVVFAGVGMHAITLTTPGPSQLQWDYVFPLNEIEELAFGLTALTTCSYVGWYFGPTGWIASSACGLTALA